MSTKKKIIITVLIGVAFILFFELVVSTRDVYAEGTSAVFGLLFVTAGMILFNFLWKKKPPKKENE